jgi:predicted nucleic acid-binding protein
LADASVTVYPQSRESFLAGLRLYEQRFDKGYSMVDCVSMASMRHHEITEILKNDRHFVQEGFEALLR